jgi:purine-binding chemotaxis protein CheW
MNDLPYHGCCTFRIGDACFALPADGVVEVLRGGRLTRVPLAPDGILGLLHLRGRIVPVIDPATHLGVSRKTPEQPTHLVIALQDDWYGLVIDEMLDVVEIPQDRIEQPSPSSAEGPVEGPGEALAGVFAAPDRLVHLLDPQRMIQSFVRQRPQTLERQATSHGRP